MLLNLKFRNSDVEKKKKRVEVFFIPLHLIIERQS